jgi:hypothetical protein
MTDFPFTAKLSTTSAGYSSGIDLGIIEDPSPSWENKCDPMDYPDTPPVEQEFYDFSGASLQIEINGWKAFSNWADAIAWKESIAKLLTGSQYDDSAQRWLAIYIHGYTGFTNELWFLRDDMTVAQDSASNGPVHVILESFKPKVKSGDQPAYEYSLRCYQQVKY